MRIALLTVVVLVLPVWGVAVHAGEGAAGDSVVRKTAESFDEAAWAPGAWNRAAGTTRLSGEVASDAGGGKCMEIEMQFAGKGFEWFGTTPPEPLVIPGDVRTVTMRYATSDKQFPVIVTFHDGWGRSAVGSKKLEWAPPAEAGGKWGKATFRVPEDWVCPVTIASIGTHNWEVQSEARTVRFRIDAIEVETDLRDVVPETGALRTWKPDPQPADPAKALKESPRAPLVGVQVTTGQVSNVFATEAPTVSIRVRHWKTGTLTGTMTARVKDLDGGEVDRQERRVSVESAAQVTVPLKTERYGVYDVEVALALSDGTKREERMRLARVPPPVALTEAEKRASPYGVNVHGGGSRPPIIPFSKAGLVWFRDYAFSYEWLVRAKGEDKRYAGWPWYPSIMRRYKEAGVKVLPCLMKSIRRPEVKDGKAVGAPGPDRAWIREIADVVLAFPEVTHWELDNEYELHDGAAAAEIAIGWANYRAYHRKFAEVIDVLGGGDLVAVEQGRAGIWPDRVRACVESGDFAKIGAVNTHHYCGTDGPEANYGNWNTGFEGGVLSQPPMLFFDRLRETKRAASADGRPRESWFTEFGWDTLAGPVVSPRQQAVYLARAWMVALAAGTDKCFWFYDYDGPEPKQFFDGCGLLAADGSPKLSLCALAGLAAALPAPKYVGSLSAGEGTWGAVFESRGDLVAALWTIENESGPEVKFKAKELRDYLGNRLPGNSARLSMAPVYAIGLAKDDAWYRQTAYALATPGLVPAASGDAVTAVLEVSNNRDSGIECSVKMTLPKGWSAERTEAKVAVAKGGRESVPLAFTIAGGEEMGIKVVKLVVSEGGPVKEIPLQVLVRPGLGMQVGALEGKPGPATVTVKVANRSSKPLDGVLRLRLPASWKAGTAETKVADLKPGEVRDVTCALEWSASWKADESAMAEFDAGGGRKVARPIIPNRYVLQRAKALKVDGALDDWPAEARMPAWMLGTTLGDAGAKVYLAWAPEGLYAAVEVEGAVLDKTDPRSFWAGNCLEIFLDTRDEKGGRAYEPGDHQFWFVPLPEEKRVYVGRWKRGSEMPETRYDIPGIRSTAAVRGSGYVMEFLLPAAELEKFRPAAGGRIGLNVNLTVKGKEYTREVFWPVTKGANIQERPGAWGTMELAE